MPSKRLLQTGTGLLLLILPVLLVWGTKKTSLGAVWSTPPARQLGAANAPVTIVEYSDFQCPSCAHTQPYVHELQERYAGKVRIIFKFFPLTRIHPNAMSAAHAAQCSAEQNKFWPYEEKLFAAQAQWAPLTDPTTHYLAIAAATQVNMDTFTQCYGDPSRRSIIEKDMAEGEARDVHATPTFFINEERLVGGVFSSDGARVIEKELR